MLPMRVDGPPRIRYTRLGFSPQAIFRPERAPGNFISCTVRAGISFRIALRPPIRFAEPGNAWMVVIPPAIASGICGSCGQNECSAHTSAVTGFEHSAVLTLDSVGDGISSTISVTSVRGCRTVQVIRDPHSWGYVYGAVTEHLGYRRGDGEGTVMALAAYGDPNRF